jgi:hypothetical protein
LGFSIVKSPNRGANIRQNGSVCREQALTCF